jgi:pyrroline-5-carboxylate reductase
MSGDFGAVCFVGAGNMAEALIRALVKGGTPASSLRVTDVRADRLEFFHRELRVEGAADNASAARGAAVVVLAVKPQAMDGVLQSLCGAVAPDALILSIAAGVPCARIEAALGGAARVVRAMPNTPALVAAGASAICAGANATATDLDRAEALLRPAGRVVRVAETDMDAVTALSGSGPAYVFLLIEQMLASAAEFGLDPEAARSLVIATVAGSARLLEETGLDPREARRRVTSEKGTTDAAIRTMESRGVPAALREAFAAARRRAAELSGKG